jgi:hypothetical protein
MTEPERPLTGTIVAVAGRRIDAADASPRFPLANVAIVAERIRAFLASSGAAALVGSAACGADLIALEEAGALGLARRVVLPFPPDRFRDSSVTDRPGDWGPRYDRLLAELGDGGVRTLLLNGDDDDVYAAVNDAILDDAIALAEGAADGGRVSALVIWDGASRGDGDLTAAFLDRARARRLPVAEVGTL